jgi:hypothetical protein
VVNFYGSQTEYVCPGGGAMTGKFESAAEIIDRYATDECKRLFSENERRRKNVTVLLEHTAFARACFACKAPIYMLTHISGARMPYNPDGSPHWATCPDADQFRRRKKGAA